MKWRQKNIKKNSQLYIEWVLALPKEDEIILGMKKELILRFIKYKGWVEEGIVPYNFSNKVA